MIPRTLRSQTPLLALLVLPSLVLANLMRHNEQGLSPTHTYKSSAPSEAVSNLNGNLTITSVAADISRVPLGIRVERAWNSHWREALFTQQLDLWYDKFVPGGNDDQGPEYRNWDAPDRKRYEGVPYGGGFMRRYRYEIQSIEDLPTMWPFFRNLGFDIAKNEAFDAMKGVPKTGTKGGSTKPGGTLPDAGKSGGISDAIPWAMVGSMAADVGWKLLNNESLGDQWEQFEKDLQTPGGILSFGRTTAALGAKVLQSTNHAVAGEALGSVAVGLGIILAVYQLSETLNNSHEWDPASELVTFAAFANVGLAVATLVNPYVAIGALVFNVAVAVIQYLDMENNRFDVAEAVPMPWTLGVNGYLGMVGTKYAENQTRSGWGGERVSITEKTEAGVATVYCDKSGSNWGVGTPPSGALTVTAPKKIEVKEGDATSTYELASSPAIGAPPFGIYSWLTPGSESKWIEYQSTGGGLNRRVYVELHYVVTPSWFRSTPKPPELKMGLSVMNTSNELARLIKEDREKQPTLWGGNYKKNSEITWGPMEEMNLLRADGGSSRFILNKMAVRLIGGKRYYSYTSLSKNEKTQVFYVDVRNSKNQFESERSDVVVDDKDQSPEDYYLVLDPSGQRSYFGETSRSIDPDGKIVDAKGMFRQEIYDWYWEGYWALPTSFGFVKPGDAVGTDGKEPSEQGVLVCRDAKNEITSVRFADERSAAARLCGVPANSVDKRYVEIDRVPSATEDGKIVETVSVFAGTSTTPIDQTIYTLGTHNFLHHRYKELIPDPSANSFAEQAALAAVSIGAGVAIGGPGLGPIAALAVQRSLEDLFRPCRVVRHSDQVTVVEKIEKKVSDQKSQVTRFEYDGGNLVRNYQPNGSLISYEFDRSEAESRTDGFCHRKVHWEDASDTSATKPHRVWSYQYFGWYDTKATGIKASTGERILQTEITEELASIPKGVQNGIVREPRKDTYRFRVAYDGVNIRRSFDVTRNITDITESEDPTNAKFKAENSAEYRTARFQLITQILGSDGEGNRTDFEYDGDNLVRKRESFSRSGRASPNVTTYEYDDWGNQTGEIVNSTTDLQETETKANAGQQLADKFKAELEAGTVDSTELRKAAEAVDKDAAVNAGIKIQGLDRVTTTYYKNSINGLFYLQQPDGEPEPFAGASQVLRQKYVRTLNADFDPRLAYVSGAPILKLVSRRAPAEWEARTGLFGSGWYGVYTAYDDAFRPVAETAWVNTSRVPVRHNFYTDDNNPWFRTGEAVFRTPEQILSGRTDKGTYTYTSFTSDPDYHQYEASRTLYADTFSIASFSKTTPPAGTRPLTTTTTYDGMGRPLTVKDPRDVVTTTEYDLMGRPTKVVVSKGSKSVTTKTTVYNDVATSSVPVGWTETGANGVASRVEFDRMGRLQAVRRFAKGASATGACNPTTCTSQYTDYGVYGKLRWAKDAMGREIFNEFDPYGRQKRVIVRRTGKTPTYERTYRYDDWTRTLYETDERGLVTEFHYNAYGQDTLVKRELEKGEDDQPRFYEAHSTFDNLGNLLEVQDPNGLLTRSVYNFLSKPVLVLHPDLIADTTFYDLGGQPIESIRRKMAYEVVADGTAKKIQPVAGSLGERTQVDMAYDGLNRQLLVNVKDHPELKRTFHYDSWGTASDPGMLVGIERGNTLSALYTYDMFGAMTSRSMTLLPKAGVSTPLVEQTFGWSYNDDGTRASMSLPGGISATYAFDAFGRLTGMDVTPPTGKGTKFSVVKSIDYDADDNIREIGLGSDGALSIGTRYGEIRPLLDTLSATVANTLGKRDTLYQQTYAYDAGGNITGLQRFNGEIMDMQYDKLNQLTALRYPGGVIGGRANQIYRYDLNGNRMGMSHDFGGYSIDYRPGSENPGSLPSASSTAHLNLMREMLDTATATRVSYGFDARGNRTADTTWNALDASHASGKWSGRREFRYSNVDELERVFRWAGPASAAEGWAYGYDESGYRVSKRTLGGVSGTDTTWSALSESGYDGVWVAVEKDATKPAGQQWRWHLRVGHRRVAELRETSTGIDPLYVVTDHLGTTNLLLDKTGKEVQRYVLDPWGNIEQVVVSSDDAAQSAATTFLYTGKEFDSETGLYYFNARLYDPNQGVWLGRDPKLQFFSPYSFVGNGTLSGMDFTGKAAAYVGISGKLALAFGVQDTKGYAIDFNAIVRNMGHRLAGEQAEPFVAQLKTRELSTGVQITECLNFTAGFTLLGGFESMIGSSKNFNLGMGLGEYVGANISLPFDPTTGRVTDFGGGVSWGPIPSNVGIDLLSFGIGKTELKFSSDGEWAQNYEPKSVNWSRALGQIMSSNQSTPLLPSNFKPSSSAVDATAVRK